MEGIMKTRKRPKKVYVGLRLPVPLVKKYDERAKADGVSRSEAMRQKLAESN